MRRFRFQLEGVLRLRRQEEQVVQGELARAMAERVAVEAELEASRAAEAELYEYLRTSAHTAAEMAHVARYGRYHRRQLFDLGVKLRQHDKAVEVVRERLAVASRRREALDQMREKQLRVHRAAELAEEQRALDELATLRHRIDHGLVPPTITAAGAAA